MRSAVLHHFEQHKGTDLYISAAAISDFAPHLTEGKIPSGKPASISLEPLPKLLSEVIDRFHPLTLAFKLDRAPEKSAREMLARGVAMVLMNPPETMGSADGSYVLLDKNGMTKLDGSKTEIAARVFAEIARLTAP
jgi:phosphopantothenoylcysteine decarboxylase/phosphopantothenate--cysteine ligase